jgi:hypothetical protein
VTTARNIAALAVVLGLAAAPAALAAPAGSEYLPQVPKTPHHDSGGGGGSTTTDSSTGYSSGYTSTTQDSDSGSAKARRSPEPPKHSHRPKVAAYAPVAAAEPDSGKSGAVIPIALALGGAIILAGGFLTRRRQRRQLRYQAEKRRRIEALEG